MGEKRGVIRKESKFGCSLPVTRDKGGAQTCSKMCSHRPDASATLLLREETSAHPYLFQRRRTEGAKTMLSPGEVFLDASLADSTHFMAL